VHVLALVVVTDRRNGPASDVADHIATTAIAMRIRMSTSVGNEKRSIEQTQ
jgi:hypothetical protein